MCFIKIASFKKNRGMLYKSVSLQVKGLDEPKGIVDAYVNSFDFEDTDGDISARGSFSKTIVENFQRIKHFLNHSKWDPLGLPLELNEDQFGLRVLSQMTIANPLPLETFEMYKAHAELDRQIEHSIGYNVIKRNTENENIIEEYKLWEYSTLSGWGANEKTPLLGLKGRGEELTSADIVDDMVLINRVLKNDGLKHSRLKELEKHVQILNETLKSLIEPEAGEPTTQEPSGFMKTLDESINKVQGKSGGILESLDMFNK